MNAMMPESVQLSGLRSLAPMTSANSKRFNRGPKASRRRWVSLDGPPRPCYTFATPTGRPANLPEVPMARIDAYLVAGGKWHDINYARLELLKLLHEDEEVRVRVGEDYRDLDAIRAADFLVSYTCDVRPTEDQQDALRDIIGGGKRWLALHATNSALDFTPGGVNSPRCFPKFAELLGSQFIAHPPIMPYTVTTVAAAHPLVAGIGEFEVDDELYLSEMHGSVEPLLVTHFNGEAKGFVEAEWRSDEPRVVAYLHPWGRGHVYYNTLGHCRHKYDMQAPPLNIPEYPKRELGAWATPQFYELLRRGLKWAKGQL